MKAAIHARYGPPEVLQIADVPKPVPGKKDLLIKVHASTVNRTDCGFRSAEYFVSRFFSGLFKPKNQVLGNEFSGEIEAVGNSVTMFKPGEKVFGYNDSTFGGNAEYLTIKENNAVVRMPENMSFQEAAPISEGAHYALANLRAAKIQAGHQVLINGATGGIGSAAVQLAKHFGAEVTAVCGPENLELVRSLGAGQVIDYKKEDFTMLDSTFDIVFDAVGKSSFGKCKPLLKKRGIYMSTELGHLSQNPLLALVTPLGGGKKVLFPIPLIHKEDLLFLKDLVESGAFSPLIDRHYPLDQIVEAHRYVETGQKKGNVVINIGPFLF